MSAAMSSRGRSPTPRHCRRASKHFPSIWRASSTSRARRNTTRSRCKCCATNTARHRAMRNCAKSSTPPAARPISLKAKPRLRGVRLRGASLRFALLVYSQQPAAAENAFALRDAWKIVVCTATRTPAQARLARGLPQEALTYEADVDRIYLNSSTSRCVGPTGQAEASALLKWFTEPFDMIAENALPPSGRGGGREWLRRKPNLAGAEGFEPSNAGIKIRCLTTWRRPNRPEIQRFSGKRRTPWGTKAADHRASFAPVQCALTTWGPPA